VSCLWRRQLHGDDGLVPQSQGTEFCQQCRWTKKIPLFTWELLPWLTPSVPRVGSWVGVRSPDTQKPCIVLPGGGNLFCSNRKFTLLTALLLSSWGQSLVICDWFPSPDTTICHLSSTNVYWIQLHSSILFKFFIYSTKICWALCSAQGRQWWMRPEWVRPEWFLLLSKVKLVGKMSVEHVIGRCFGIVLQKTLTLSGWRGKEDITISSLNYWACLLICLLVSHFSRYRVTRFTFPKDIF
jgi:hypothetical protein